MNAGTGGRSRSSCSRAWSARRARARPRHESEDSSSPDGGAVRRGSLTGGSSAFCDKRGSRGGAGTAGRCHATEGDGRDGFTASGAGNINDVVNMPAQSTLVYKATGMISIGAAEAIFNSASVSRAASHGRGQRKAHAPGGK